MMKKQYEPPQTTNADVGAAAVRALVQAVPFGGSALELFNQAIGPPLERRRDEWMNEVAEALRAHDVAIDELRERDEFLDTMVQATRAAMGTSSSEKRAALRNAVVNTAVRNEPYANERHMFLQLVERFTPWHLRLLKAFEYPMEWAQRHNVNYRPAMTSSLDAFLLEAFPELNGKRDFYDSVWEELTAAGMVNSKLHTMMSETGWQAPRTTPRGNRFLRFIEEPKAEA